ncbi:hypothetical protein SLEP1_g9392 [Rubroshorea leprosula]|uniref:Uncharacterized protein n=1 Tax=Rubroshorea leprosula TaxID=152421 RepID=A0AAV5IE36_9ROSI|nr:hypothetical protein SLEP1_g9392 [Rubroshorea leprosula]
MISKQILNFIFRFCGIRLWYDKVMSLVHLWDLLTSVRRLLRPQIWISWHVTN